MKMTPLKPLSVEDREKGNSASIEKRRAVLESVKEHGFVRQKDFEYFYELASKALTIEESGIEEAETGPPASTEREIGFQEGWDLAHESARCGHARANWRDPNWGTTDYKGDERCEVCKEIRALEVENADLKEQSEWLDKVSADIMEMLEKAEARVKELEKALPVVESTASAPCWGERFLGMCKKPRHPCPPCISKTLLKSWKEG